MSEDSKSLVKPKVSFSKANFTTGNNDSSKITRSTRPNRPKIKEIITIKQPIKVVSSKLKRNDTQNTNKGVSDKLEHLGHNLQECKKLSVLSEENIVSPMARTSTCKHDDIKPLCDVANVQNIKANVLEDYMCADNNVDATSSKPDRSDQNVCQKLAEAETKNKHDYTNCIETVRQEGKENQNLEKKQQRPDSGFVNKIFSKPKLSKSSEHHKNKQSNPEGKQVIFNRKRNKSGINTQSIKQIQERPVPCVLPMQNLNRKGVTNVMPCLKYKQVGRKKKTDLIKKTLERDVVSHKVNPYIGPGVSHSRNDGVQVIEKDNQNILQILAVIDKFSYPQCNSILHTVHAFNEAKKEKLVKNIESLPPAIKNFVHKKISTALDFPLNEAIYKHLVDLSIDEKQLPNRLIRSKDPEPRQRDVVPQLSDFFTPKPSEEYCTAVNAKTCCPGTVESWNAFKISNKILEWKQCVDDGE